MAFEAAKGDKQQYVVVIDAGHGGSDLGACDNGVKEKDINLGVALKVGEILKKEAKNIKVVYTRNDDNFISLQGRADKANKEKASLFVSIHSNSVAESNPNRKTVAGASVYTLGTHKDDANMAVAQRENSVISLEKNSAEKYAGFDPNSDESYIIFEMAQKKNLSQSIKFAKMVQNQLVSHAGRVDRGIHQAGFWVLWATSMPSVLVELDFICNPNSAKYIASKQGQAKLAEAIANSIKEYFDTSKQKAMQEPEPADEPEFTAAETRQRLPEKTPVHLSSPTAKTQQQTTGNRKRRNEKAQAASNRREVEVENVTIKQNFTETATVASALETEPVKETASVKKETKTEKKNSSKNKNNQKKHAQRDKAVSIYTIQLLVSDSQLSSSNSAFCGLQPINMKKENNLYKYFYGESEEKREMETLLKEVKQKIPEAKIVKTTKLIRQ